MKSLSVRPCPRAKVPLKASSRNEQRRRRDPGSAVNYLNFEQRRPRGIYCFEARKHRRQLNLDGRSFEAASTPSRSFLAGGHPSTTLAVLCPQAERREPIAQDHTNAGYCRSPTATDERWTPLFRLTARPRRGLLGGCGSAASTVNRAHVSRNDEPSAIVGVAADRPSAAGPRRVVPATPRCRSRRACRVSAFAQKPNRARSALAARLASSSRRHRNACRL